MTKSSSRNYTFAECSPAGVGAAHWKAEHLAGNAEIERLQTENKSLLADARRYQWLRDGKHNKRDTADSGYLDFGFDCVEFGFDANRTEDRRRALDAAIDNAVIASGSKTTSGLLDHVAELRVEAEHVHRAGYALAMRVLQSDLQLDDQEVAARDYFLVTAMRAKGDG